MATTTSRLWWYAVIQSISAILFGILAILWPGPALGVLIIFFGAFALVWGGAAIAAAIGHRGEDRYWWLHLISGFAGIIAGLIAFFMPVVTALSLLYLFVSWVLVIGIIEIAEAIRGGGRPAEVRWAFGLSGIVSVLFGVLLLAEGPAQGLLVMVWLIGIYAIINGVIWGFRAYRLAHHARVRA